MASRVSFFAFGLTTALVIAPGCVTPGTSSVNPATTTTTTSAASDPEVVLLRERVTRLEKRLVDVDGKLALLLARIEPGPATTAAPMTPRIARPPERQESPRADDGLASIDIERSPAGDVDVDVDAGRTFELPLTSADAASEGASEGASDGDNTGTVVLKMHGNAPAIIEGASAVGGGDDDPLSALRSASDLYAWGQARLKEARYLEAVAAFEDVVGRFPKDDLADNAMYWIGSCHQARGEHRLAIAEWQKLPARFPKSPKIPDALYGMAVGHEALGEPAVAEVLYDEIVASYPKAEKLPDARKAIARLRPSR